MCVWATAAREQVAVLAAENARLTALCSELLLRLTTAGVAVPDAEALAAHRPAPPLAFCNHEPSHSGTAVGCYGRLAVSLTYPSCQCVKERVPPHWWNAGDIQGRSQPCFQLPCL